MPQNKAYSLQLINHVANQCQPNPNAQGDAYYSMGVVTIQEGQLSENNLAAYYFANRDVADSLTALQKGSIFLYGT